MDTLVSIIVPVYNEERYLTACVNSILHQTVSNFELILVNDGSTNNAGNLCDSFAKKDSRVRVVHKLNGGLSSARITGLKLAKGAWVAFVDNDDIISPFMLEHFKTFADDIDVDIVSGQRVDLIDPDKYDWTGYSGSYPEANIKEGKWVCSNICRDKQKNIITPIWGKLYRKSFLDQLNLEEYMDLCPIIYFEDVLMTPILFYNANKIVLVNEPVYLHREVATSISRSGKLSQFYFDQIESGNVLLEFYQENKLYDMYSYQLQIYFRTILRIWYFIKDYSMDDTLKKTYIAKIVKYYNKYWMDFIIKVNCSIINKLALGTFRINHGIWRMLVGNMFYKVIKKHALNSVCSWINIYFCLI